MRGPLQQIVNETYLPKGRGGAVLLELICGHYVVRIASRKPKHRCHCSKCDDEQQGLLFALDR